METTKRIIEVNGVKMEIDLRDATVVSNYKVWDTIKLLKKTYSSWESHLWVIIGFDNFEKLPTICIAYLEKQSYDAKISFAYYNSWSQDMEITVCNDWDIPYKKQDIIDLFNKEEQKKKEELREIEKKREVFEKLFSKYFENWIGA